jgi:hypothetical protein
MGFVAEGFGGMNRQKAIDTLSIEKFNPAIPIEKRERLVVIGKELLTLFDHVMLIVCHNAGIGEGEAKTTAFQWTSDKWKKQVVERLQKEIE